MYKNIFIVTEPVYLDAQKTQLEQGDVLVINNYEDFHDQYYVEGHLIQPSQDGEKKVDITNVTVPKSNIKQAFLT
jgi:hypothetical protein